MKKQFDIKKIVLLNLPYLLMGLFATNFGEAWRLAQGANVSEKFLSLFAVLPGALQSFWPSLHPLDLLVGLCCGAGLRLAVYLKSKNAKKYRHGMEYGSARWGTREDIAPYIDPVFQNNVILTKTESLTMNSRPKDPKTARNKNVLVIGGSGSGKTRFWLKPNLMQMHSSYVVTDPKGTILVECGKMLQRGAPKLGKDGKPMKDKHGKVIYEPYRIKVLNTINFRKSMHYNPFAYIHSEKDILKLVTTLIANTKGEGKAGDDFWVKAETLLYCALIGYIHYEAPVEEQNFSTLIEFINAMEVREDDEEFKNPVDLMFDALEAEKPNHFAVRQYKKYKLAAGKTAKSILISVGVRLAAFNLKEIANLTCTDELDLASIGEKKVALFCCIPDADTSLNYLVGMIYSNLFQTLYYVADRKYGGRLPVPVHCIMDEWPNVALPDDFDKILATMRSRAISCSIIIQNMAQMKALFKDSWESLVGNCDELLYLGGNEKEGHKYISELLGKETLDTNTYGQTKGRNGSYSTNYQQTGRELFTPDEIRLLDNRKAILFVRGERPMLDDKYNLKKHPNVKWTEDGGAPPYDYAKAPRSHDDLNIDIERLDDYELLCEEDILGKEQPF
ncbi:type IV secretory system conjugative DNA transfer family protein [Mediterraneibacter gnavus]|uniref:Type IV secretory system conjugative DNA transfer family protein n=1 Tax=Mediterraneibacter gnavus TaxID=33038 RepID=A0A412NIP6_MEDGN|nr:type IV secretory system conjugative DNA transfer family protein [Mediterraneibacter gnavus]RGT39117.1 type IV secretory system conjugative DNA transfer family protein [Mediterraneibacter gnavus]